MAASKSLVRAESGKVRRVIVVGGGLAGLMTVIKLCEAGVPVDLFSLLPVKRSHSGCARGGPGEARGGPAPPPHPRPAEGGVAPPGAGLRLHARPDGRAVQPHA